jgi:hypothetical protein
VAGVVVIAALALAPAARATTITLSLESSDETPAGVLDATLDFVISDTAELTLTVTNDTTAPDEYNINQIFFNGASNVTGLTLVGATHSDDSAGNNFGDVFSLWNPVETDTMVDGFGTFDFGLTDGMGETAVSVIGPGESIAFVLSISGTQPFTMDDFNVPGDEGRTAAAKFVNGPGDDSGFGGVPEPMTALLVGVGLLGLGMLRRHRPL